MVPRSPIRLIVGVARATVLLATYTGLTVLIVLVSWVPMTIRDATLSAWLSTVAGRVGLLICGVRVRGDQLHQIRDHDGLLFANHQSWMDILVLCSIVPLRWLSAIENRRVPFVGSVAASIGTVFVDRGSDESRAIARRQVAEAPKKPALVIFPEGGIPDEGILDPFRYGSFELATEGSIPILPVVIHYQRIEHVRWRTEALPASLWNAFAHNRSQTAWIEVLPIIEPTPDHDPAALANDLHERMRSRLAAGPSDVAS